MRKYGLLIAASFALVSCVHEVEVARPSAKSRRRAPAPATLSARQSSNAVDLGDGDIIAKSLRQKLIKNPNDLEARLALAAHYRQRGSPELALDHYAMAARRFPDNTKVPVLAAQTLRSIDAAGEAAALLLAYWNSHPKNTPASVLSELGIVRDELGDFADAEYAYRAALVLEPKTAAIHNNLGYNLLLQGKNQQAADEFHRALSVEPHSQIARDNLGIALAGSAKDSGIGSAGGDHAAADRASDARAAGNRKAPSVRCAPPGESGTASRRTPFCAGSLEEALLNFQSVSGPATAHNNLAAVLIEQGRYTEARQELNVAFSFQKDFPAALDNLRLVSELDGKPATIAEMPAPVTHRKRIALSSSRSISGKPETPQETVIGKTTNEAAQAASPKPEE
ncbi:MAG: tetratricopeptide repeat protein [Bryobacteraceae bacterium]